MRVIYDIGANNGDDIPYYLLKSDLVVAIEANPVLARIIQERFSNEISSGRLAVENFVITVDDHPGIVDFYIHKTMHVLSQLTQPNQNQVSNFEKVRLPAKNIIDVIHKHGTPYYIKIDIENFDHAILRKLFDNNIFPPYISAESHIIDVFCLFVVNGNYRSFKLVDGASVSEVYKDYNILTSTGSVKYNFPYDSAGPFGNDLIGSWETPETFLQTLAQVGLGWKDIHVSNVD